MFGFFKKKKQQKKNNDFVIEPLTKVTLIRTAKAIHMQLLICRSIDGYISKMDTPYVRGYIFGFIDAALQYSNVDIGDDERFFSLMKFGHMELLGEDDGIDYVSASAMMQDNIDFQRGQADGGGEYFDYLSENIRSPIKLIKHFHGL